jgi:hypothetical protein
MNNSKVCIIYWGLIRGFKHDCAFNSHKKYLYDILKDKNIDFDIYLVTNNIEYNEEIVNKIPNLKLLNLINIEEIHNCGEYNTALKNINFTTQGWSDKFQNNLLTVYYNKQQLANIIPNNYRRYISMDIGQIINKLDFKLLLNNFNITSSFETSTGINPRFLIGNYSCISTELNKFNYILNTKNKLTFINPEYFIKYYFEKLNVNIIQSNLVEVLRIREDGTNQNGIKYPLDV